MSIPKLPVHNELLWRRCHSGSTLRVSLSSEIFFQMLKETLIIKYQCGYYFLFLLFVFSFLSQNGQFRQFS